MDRVSKAVRFVFLLLVSLFVCIRGDSRGAPSEACNSLSPLNSVNGTITEVGHDIVESPQTSQPHYLDLRSLTGVSEVLSYTPGQAYRKQKNPCCLLSLAHTCMCKSSIHNVIHISPRPKLDRGAVQMHFLVQRLRHI